MSAMTALFSLLLAGLIALIMMDLHSHFSGKNDDWGDW